ncbi:MAG: hypothetical protein KDD58_13050 [Bdellovibrionales bacterium]|nr:hypothetical protein [Bdellovibrionales bacterium]
MAIFSFFILIISTYAFAKKPYCEISRLSVPPEVHIIGEDHDSFDGVKNMPIHEKIRAILFNGASESKFPLATEVGSSYTGNLYPWDKSSSPLDKSKRGTLHGIESPIAHGVLASYKFQNMLIWESSSEFRVLSAAINFIYSSPIFSKAFQSLVSKLKKKEKSASYHQIVRQIQEGVEIIKNSALPSNKATDEAYKAIPKMQASPEQIRFFMNDLHKEVVTIANQKYLGYFGRKSLPFYLEKKDSLLIGKIGNTYLKNSIYYDIAITRRDQDFCDQIANLICAYVPSYNKLFVLVGQKHLPGVQKCLEKLGGANLKVKSFMPKTDEDIHKITKLTENTKRNHIVPLYNTKSRTDSKKVK